MNHKQKAKDLVDAVYAFNSDKEFESYTQIPWPVAKKIAAMNADEIINEMKPLSTDYSMGVGFWQQVKEEINKL
jgi:hypothetical protein